MSRARLTYATAAAVATLGLSACGSVIPPSAVPKPVFTPATPRPAQPDRPLPAEPSSSGIIGSDARALIRLLGEPRLDIRDPEARKLQFSNGRCILDAYLYAQRSRREPVVSYAEARTTAGATMDVATCVGQLRAR